MVPAALAIALLPHSAAAAAEVETSPAIVPAYSERTSDFTVRCEEPVRVSVTAGRTEKVSVDGALERSGEFARTVRLAPGQAFRIRTSDGSSRRTQTVRCLPDDLPLWTVERRGTPRSRWLVMTPDFRLTPGQKLPSLGPPYVVIANGDGVPVWWYRTADGAPVDGKLLKGNRIGWGTFVNGAPFRTVSFNGRPGASYGFPIGESEATLTNFHDMEPTSDGGALLLGESLRNCPKVASECVDLTRWGGPASAVVIDNVIRRIDRRGRTLWTWSTRGNIDPSEASPWTGHPSLAPREYEDGRLAEDLFHVNSMEEHRGGVIISVRHTNAIYRIPASGRGVAWKLGGTRTRKSLRVVGAGSGSRLMNGQHDARVLGDGSISVYDNQSFQPRAPRALRFKLRGRVARLVESVGDGQVAFSVCCGSARRLAGGHWAVAWGGGSSRFSEIDRRGRPVLALAFPDGLFSYRVDARERGVSARSLRAGMDAQYPR